jgi:TrmH family RNA methyltransferase
MVRELHNAKGRSEHNLFIAEGLRICSSLLQSKLELKELYATPVMQSDAFTLVPRSRVTLVDEHVMEYMSAASTASGILGVFTLPKQSKASQLTSGLVLARIADPGNMGTLIRSAAAMGIRSVVVIEGADVWSPKVVQASAGTIGSVHIFCWSWQHLVEHRAALPLCALVARDGASADMLPSESLIVVGSEAHGIPDAWVNDCQSRVTLAMPGNTESLNAAVAGSIALYLAHARKAQTA